jgi:hypothetical protein
VADSIEAFTLAWNAAATASGNPSLSINDPGWQPLEVAGAVGTFKSYQLSSNVVLVAASAAKSVSLSEVFVVWLPLTNAADQPAQNAVYNNAFLNLTKSVNPAVTSAQQTALTTDFALSTSQPPYPAGTSHVVSDAAPPQRYELFTLPSESGTGEQNLIGVFQKPAGG